MLLRKSSSHEKRFTLVPRWRALDDDDVVDRAEGLGEVYKSKAEKFSVYCCAVVESQESE